MTTTLLLVGMVEVDDNDYDNDDKEDLQEKNKGECLINGLMLEGQSLFNSYLLVDYPIAI